MKKWPRRRRQTLIRPVFKREYQSHLKRTHAYHNRLLAVQLDTGLKA